MILKPKEEDIPEYYRFYISQVEETDLLDALTKDKESTLSFIASIPAEKEDFAYAPGKWTIKEVLTHIIDTERIFAYRALRFSRHDAIELPGYDQNEYAVASGTAARSLQHIGQEYKAVREATISLYEYLSDDMLDFKGRANNTENTARCIGWIITGHNIHHCRVIREKYL